MTKSRRPHGVWLTRLLVVSAALVLTAGCGIFRTKSKITVPQLLTPLATADTSQLVNEINRQAGVQSLNGRVDLQFLDTSFAKCGLADLYRTADGRVVVQRPGQVYVLVQFLTVRIAEMSSNGQRFWAAVYQGDDRFKRFVTGTNTAEYERLDSNGAAPDCTGDDKRREQAMQRATVTAISSMRPQHFTDALLVPPIATENSDLVYAQNEAFEEESDTRPNAKKGARVVRGYYVLTELEPQGPGRARVLRRFWLDRVGAVRLARVQTYNQRGELVTDVKYGGEQSFGEEGPQQRRLPVQIELTRPQESYALRITFQDPGSVKVDQPLPPDAFVLKNTSNLQEVDLDARKK